MFTMFTVTCGHARSGFGGVGQVGEERWERPVHQALRIGFVARAALPRRGEAVGIEPGEQPHQQFLARHAAFADQLVERRARPADGADGSAIAHTFKRANPMAILVRYCSIHGSPPSQ